MDGHPTLVSLGVGPAEDGAGGTTGLVENHPEGIVGLLKAGLLLVEAGIGIALVMCGPAHAAVLADEALAVLVDEHHVRRVARVVGAHGLLVLLRQIVVADGTVLGGGHVAQLHASLHEHADAVARVVGATDVELVEARYHEVLDHLVVCLKATACHDDALGRLDADFLVALLHADAEDLLGGRILDKVRDLGVIVDRDRVSVAVMNDGVDVVPGTLTAALAVERLVEVDHHRVLVGVGILHAVELFGGAVGVVLGDVGVDDVLAEPLGHELGGLGDSLALLIGRAAVSQGLPILDRALARHDVEVTTAHGAVAAGVLLGGLLENLHLGALDSSRNGRSLAGIAIAHDDNVGLDVPSLGSGVGVARSLVGQGNRGHAERTGSDAGGGALQEGTTRSGGADAHVIPLLLSLLREGVLPRTA